MIPNYKQSCHKIVLDWDNDLLPAVFFTEHCPFCGGTLFIENAYVECHYCKYSILGNRSKGIACIYYQNTSTHRLDRQSLFRCCKSFHQYKDFAQSPLTDFQTLLNKINFFTLSKFI